MDPKFLIQQHRKRKLTEVQIAEEVLGLELWPMQKWLIEKFFQTKEDGRPKFEEWMLICGKKSSKTFISAVANLILVYKLLLMENMFKNDRWNIVPQDIYLLNTCAGKEQSIKVYLNQVKGITSQSNFMQEFAEAPRTDELRFKIPNSKKKIVLKAQSSRSTSSLGYTCFSNCFDELAWFMDANNRSSAKECYSSLSPNIKPFNGYGYNFILTSPSDDGSWAYSHFDFSKASAKRLVLQKSTWEMNPNYNESDFDEEKLRDYERWCTDWKGEWIKAISGAFHPERIEKAITLDIRDISVRDKRQRVISLDPALKHDAYALAMGYVDDKYKIYVDYVHYWQGTRDKPVQLKEVEDFIRYLYKNYNISKIVLDQRYSANTIQKLSSEGMPIYETFFDGGYKQRMYQSFKEKLNMNELFLPHDEKVKSELIALRRLGTGAHIKYEAPTTGAVKTDDMADAVANCVHQLVLLSEGEGGGTDDFAIEGESVLLDEESIKEKMKKMTPEQRAKHKEEIEKIKEQEEKEVKQVEATGGFACG